MVVYLSHHPHVCCLEETYGHENCGMLLEKLPGCKDLKIIMNDSLPDFSLLQMHIVPFRLEGMIVVTISDSRISLS